MTISTSAPQGEGGSTSQVLERPTLPADPIVEARHLRKVYGRGDSQVVALDDVTVGLGRAEFTAIMGPSGSGKSTLLHCLAGLDAATSGTIVLDGRDVTRMRERQRTTLRRDHIGFVFQSFNLVPTLTARENITLPADIAHRKLERGAVDRIADALGLTDRLRHRPAELSGGQQQRVAIARALVTSPAVIFADEPTGNLDSRASHQVLAHLRHAVGHYQQSIVMVTHDPTAAAWADRVIFLSDGRIAAEMRRPTRERVLEALARLGDQDVGEEAEDARTGAAPRAEAPGSALAAAPGGGAATPDRRPADAPRLRSMDPQTASTLRVAAHVFRAAATEHPDRLREELMREPLQRQLSRLAPQTDLPPEAAHLVDRAQRILDELPGPVVPPEDEGGRRDADGTTQDDGAPEHPSGPRT